MRAAAIIAVSTCAFGAVGCGNVVHDVHAPGRTKVSADKPAIVAVVLVDVSKSTVGQRRRYGTYFRTVLDGLTGGTLLIADQIDADPLSSASLPVRAFLEKSSLFGKNPAVVKSDNERTRSKAMKGFGVLLGRRPKGNSILDALDIASDVFAAYPDAKARYLVILSDMVENSSRYRFTNENLLPSKVTAFVRRARKTAALPDLRGVQTYVAGAGATKGVEVDPNRFRAVRGFWIAYFTASGAILPRYHYGSELVRFP